MKHELSRFLTLAVLSACLASAAQAAEGDKPSIIVQMMSSTCPVIVGQMTGRPEMAAVFKARAIDVASVCTCTSLSMNADAKLKTRFTGDAAAAGAGLADENVKSYLTLRLLSSVLSCLVPELDASLKATPL